MKVSGFTIIRNAVKYDYPAKESIMSVLPAVDEFIVLVGNSEDETIELIKSIDSDKIKIYHSVWDDNLRQGGKVLADETNKAFNLISQDSDWCFYIQADEVMHEKYIPIVKEEMNKWKENQNVDGLLFNYHHFYGSYDYIGESYRWYRKEIRIIRNNKNIYSYLDAQGFRKNDNQKLNVKLLPAYIYHYGWVREPQKLQQKTEHFSKFWHSDDWIDQNIKKADEFDYSEVDALEKFNGTHPNVMIDRINRKNWQFDYDLSKKKYSTKDIIRKIGEKLTGKIIGEYKNYKII